jgi:hypothetical protein
MGFSPKSDTIKDPGRGLPGPQIGECTNFGFSKCPKLQ